MAGLIGFRALRCQRCLSRFSAFAPSLREVEQSPRPTAGAVLPQPVRTAAVAAPSTTPLDEIHAIEQEWRARVQPLGLIEETLCAQLAHATWHLRSLHRAERESIAASVQRGSFNGEWAMSLMKWRLNSENAVNSALEQLEHYRRMEQRELPEAAPSVSDLMALAKGLSRGTHTQSHAMAGVGR